MFLFFFWFSLSFPQVFLWSPLSAGGPGVLQLSTASTDTDPAPAEQRPRALSPAPAGNLEPPPSAQMQPHK